MSIIVTIVGGQTIQNVMFIEQLRKNGEAIDTYLFLTTEDMERENKVKYIVSACDIDAEQAKKIIISKDSIREIKNELSNLTSRLCGNIYVSLTGGTKIMSLAIYDFFKQNFGKGKVSFHYLPFGTRMFKQIYPEEENDIVIDWKLTLKSYCKAHGLLVRDENNLNILTQSANYTKMFFEEFISNKIDGEILRGIMHKGFIMSKKEVRNKQGWKNIVKLLEEGKAVFPNRAVNEKMTSYYKGVWFEEYIYTKIKKMLNLSDDKIWIGADILTEENQQVNNEIDIMFIYNDRLNTVECKTNYSQKKGKFKSESLHKIQANKKKFGLRCKSIYCHTDSLNEENINLREAFLARANQLEITIVDRDILLDKESFMRSISEN